VSVAVWVGRKTFEIGHSAFFKSWFSTIFVRLENGDWGRSFPIIMRDFYSGAVPAEKVVPASAELDAIRAQLASFPPDQVVWDFEDRNAQPPWGQAISPRITSLANYYVTSDGKDLFEVLTRAFAEAAKTKQGITIR
jgi:2,3-bisphosphoglycerate-dependent phosphoglycerate mutase